MLVTDASSAAASPSGRGTVGGFELVVTDGVPRLPDGTLAGSTVTLAGQVAKLVRAGLPLERAANLATLRPAEFFGLPGRGILRVGGPADLVVLGPDLMVERILEDGLDVLARRVL